MSLDFSFVGEKSGFALRSQASIPSSGITGIFGETGSGKTSLLRALAGLDKHKNSYCCFKGQVWQNTNNFLPTHKRKLSLVFQNPLLFPHLKVKQLVQYGQKAKNAKAFVDKLIALCELEKLLESYPHQLSGGQKQKVALAQALANKPQLLLMDEPLSSLNLASKQKLLPIIKEIIQECGVPLIYVSHSVYELRFLAEVFFEMAQGQLTHRKSWQDSLNQVDYEVLSQELVYSFKIDSYEEQASGYWFISCLWGETIYRNLKATKSNPPKYLEIHPDSVLIGKAPGSDIGAIFQAEMEVAKIHALENAILVELQSPSHSQILGAFLSPERCREFSLAIGSKVIAYITKISLVF